MADAFLPLLRSRPAVRDPPRSRSGSERYAVCLPEPIIKELMASVLSNL